MSYTPDDQLLERPLEKILDGIAAFDGSTWADEHLNELCELRVELARLHLKLARLQGSVR